MDSLIVYRSRLWERQRAKSARRAMAVRERGRSQRSGSGNIKTVGQLGSSHSSGQQPEQLRGPRVRMVQGWETWKCTLSLFMMLIHRKQYGISRTGCTSFSTDAHGSLSTTSSRSRIWQQPPQIPRRTNDRLGWYEYGHRQLHSRHDSPRLGGAGGSRSPVNICHGERGSRGC